MQNMTTDEHLYSVNVVIHNLRIDFLYRSSRDLYGLHMQGMHAELFRPVSAVSSTYSQSVNSYLNTAINRAIWLGLHS